MPKQFCQQKWPDLSPSFCLVVIQLFQPQLNKSCWVFDNFIILLWMLLNNVNSFFCHNPNTIHESAQPCSGFANQQMFFRAAKSARPWSSPEPLKKRLILFATVWQVLPSRPAGGVTGAAGLSWSTGARAPARRPKKLWQPKVSPVWSWSNNLTTTNEQTNLVSASRAVGTRRARGAIPGDLIRNRSKKNLQ